MDQEIKDKRTVRVKKQPARLSGSRLGKISRQSPLKQGHETPVVKRKEFAGSAVGGQRETFLFAKITSINTAEGQARMNCQAVREVGGGKGVRDRGA